jgi:hypothetical protein
VAGSGVAAGDVERRDYFPPKAHGLAFADLSNGNRNLRGSVPPFDDQLGLAIAQGANQPPALDRHDSWLRGENLRNASQIKFSLLLIAPGNDKLREGIRA